MNAQPFVSTRDTPTRQDASRTACKACGTEGLERIYHLGDMPSVNAFPLPGEEHAEETYPLELTWCSACALVQLRDIIPPARLFTEYLHLSSASASNLLHLRDVAAHLCHRLGLTRTSTVLEVGSNDGSLLAEFRPRVGRVLGVDPAENLAPLARERGVETVTDFFTEDIAENIVQQRGSFDAIVALNIVPHTPDVVGLLRAVRTALAPAGTFVMEGVYIRETILRGEFDTAYHEHVYQFSLTSLARTMARAGLMVTDVERIPQQGGSLRAYARRDDVASLASPAVAALLREEDAASLSNWTTYEMLGRQYEAHRAKLRDLLEDLHARHGRVIGLGAPARGMVILNACRIDTTLVSAIVDDTPLKQGRLTPGTHIPVIPWDALATDPATAYLLLSWNYRDFLLTRLRQHARDARVLVPFPTLEVISLP